MEKDEIFLKRKLRKNGRKTTLFCQRISANFPSVPVENIRVRICVYIFSILATGALLNLYFRIS